MLLEQIKDAHLIALLIAVLLGYQTPLRANTIVNITRPNTPGADKPAEFIDYFIEKELHQKAQWQTLSPLAHLNKSWLSDAEAAFNNARSKIKSGLREFEDFELDQAIDNFNAALSLFERHIEAITDYQELSELLLVLGATHIFRGEENLGYQRLTQALLISNDVQPDPTIFNPKMRDLFNRASEEVTEMPTLPLTIKSTPGYAKIFIDGEFVGVTPHKTQQLKVGRHFIRLEKDGYRPWGQVFKVQKKRKNEILANLAPFKQFDRFDSVTEELLLSIQYAPENIQDSVTRLGQLLETDFLLTSIVNADGKTIKQQSILWRTKDGQRLKDAETTFTKGSAELYKNEIAEFYNAHFNETLQESDYEVFPMNETSYSGAPLCMGVHCDVLRKNIVITGLSLGAATLVSGLVLDYLAYQDNLNYQNQVQISQEAQDLRTAGERKALIGDILWAFGSASILTGVGVHFFWQPTISTSSNEPMMTQRENTSLKYHIGIRGIW
ncbi:MAG: PEGA domain-containing protein [Myxococcota bacterium]|jgi:hypothetical protein|nr:PEGA domain-containing protein [Myxococcota bacterium]